MNEQQTWDEGLTAEAKKKAEAGEATLWQWTIVHLAQRIEELETENAELRQQLAYCAGGDGKGLEA